MKDRKWLQGILKASKGQRLVVGIDGLSRSGKTSFVGQLMKDFHLDSIVVFHMDDLIVERSKRYGTGHAEWYEYYSLQWDVQWVRDEFLHSLKRDPKITVPVYKHELDIHKRKTYQLPDNGLIIVEGVFLQRKEWRDLFDFIVFLDCPRQTRFSREKESVQKMHQKFEQRYWKAEEHYLQVERPRRHADVVIDNGEAKRHS
ncbi:kinase [Halobacillus litoralis]|uniref:kinase n=1 Tax=Halobacillus litoralis TaxID=45668 RepID=UPI001CFD6B85|nr:kinase [Halobacillus litoralis]